MIPLADSGVAWLFAAFVYLAVLPAWDYCRSWSRRWRGLPGRLAAGLRRSRSKERLAVLLRVAYCLGVPYAALLLGVADARRMGLAGLPWWPHLPVGAATGLAGVALLAWSWGRVAAVSYRRGGRRLFVAERRAMRTAWGWAWLVLEVLCLQMSWAFVRGAAIRLAGLYAGVFLGLALLGATWLLRPGQLEGLGDVEARASAFLTAGLALVTSLVFLYSENLWLCGLVHGLGLAATALAAGRAYGQA